MSDPADIVRDMIAACEAQDLDRVLTFFHVDAVYHNVPIPAVQGHEAIRGMLAGFLDAATKVEWKIHRSLSNGKDLVMNERTDCFDLPAGRLELPVMGVFNLHDGKISAWRDYFDMGPLKGFMG